MDPVILETMNDIIDKIDRREWLRVNDEIEKLKKQRDEYLENWKSTTRKYVAVTTREQRLNLLTSSF